MHIFVNDQSKSEVLGHGVTAHLFKPYFTLDDVDYIISKFSTHK